MRDERRQFIRATGALMISPLAACGGGGDDPAPAPAPAAAPVAETTSGKFMGQVDDTVTSYLGIPYAQPPIGALRFQSPKPFKPAADGVSADKFGAASLQNLPPYVTWIYPLPAQQGEDCLTVNVWTTASAAKAPVIVWLHGGAWRTGATSMPLMDGHALAKLGVVVVTVNFRLGALGGLSHPSFTDSATGASANWQLQDQMAALQWVHQNAAAFGGDPDNICLVGQSAGGTSVALMAQNPVSRPYIRKAVLISPGNNSAPAFFTLNDAAAYVELLAARLNTTPLGLRDIPAATLHAAELALNALPLPGTFTSGGANVGPIVDKQFCLSDWTQSPWPADLPVILTTTLTEGVFFLDLIDPATGKPLTSPLPQNDAQLNAFVGGFFRLPSAAGQQLVDAYRQEAVQDGRANTAGDIWVEMFGDNLLRRHTLRYAGRLAADGVNVRFATYAHALKAPGHGVPHCADLPILFGTCGLDYYKDKVGAGPAEMQLSASLMTALVSFAEDPSKDPQAVTFGSGVVWPRYTAGTPTCALVGDGAHSDVILTAVPKLAQLAALNAALGS